MSNEQNKPGFTPGPWKISSSRPLPVPGYGSDYMYEIVSPDMCPLNDGESWQVAVVYGSAVWNDQSEEDRIVRELGLTNAHLIAAAPDMYDTLDAVLCGITYGGSRQDMVEMIVDTLAKARGEK